MGSLAESFLGGQQRVTAEIYYFKPREIGQGPLQINPVLLGHKPQELHHSGILQTFIYQCDSASDMDDPRLAGVFEEVINRTGGILKIHDRQKRIQIMTEEAHLAEQNAPVVTAPDTSLIVPQIYIPTEEEESNAGMQPVNMTFKTLVPFPALRKFLQFWQRELAGPMHHMQYAGVPIAERIFSKGYIIN